MEQRLVDILEQHSKTLGADYLSNYYLKFKNNRCTVFSSNGEISMTSEVRGSMVNGRPEFDLETDVMVDKTFIDALKALKDQESNITFNHVEVVIKSPTSSQSVACEYAELYPMYNFEKNIYSGKVIAELDFDALVPILINLRKLLVPATENVTIQNVFVVEASQGVITITTTTRAEIVQQTVEGTAFEDFQLVLMYPIPDLLSGKGVLMLTESGVVFGNTTTSIHQRKIAITTDLQVNSLGLRIPDFKLLFKPTEDAVTFIANGAMFIRLSKSFGFANVVNWKVSKTNIKCTGSSIEGKRRASENLTVVKGPDIEFNTSVSCLKMFKPQMCTIYILSHRMIFITQDNKYKFVSALLNA